MIVCRSVALAPLKTYLIVVVAFYAMDVYAQPKANGCKNNLFISLHSTFSLGLREYFEMSVTQYLLQCGSLVGLLINKICLHN